MNDDLESGLRSSLRPVAPRDEFSQKLVAQVVARARPDRSPRAMPWRASKRSTWWLSAGLAASLLLVVGVQIQMQRSARGRTGSRRGARLWKPCA